jgi:hypothetical protein
LRSILRGFSKGLFCAFLVLAPWTAAGQTESALAISHDDLECWPSDLFPVLSAEVVPPEEIRSVRIYFRSEEHPDFYFVDAVVSPEGLLETVLPVAAPETKRVVYYIEALSRSFESARTREWAPQVADSDECRRRDPLLALFQGEVPEIVVGAARAGAAAIPPGFLSTGIVGAGAGGISTIAVVGIVAGGAAGGVVLVGGGEGTSTATTTAVASPPPTSNPPPTTSTAVPSATTTTATASTPPTSTTTIGASTSTALSTTTTTAGSGTTTAPSTTTSIAGTTTTTASTTTTTAPPTTTSSTPPTTTTTTSAPPGADVSVTLSAPGSVPLVAGIRYQLVVRNNGPATATGVRVTVSLPFGLSFQNASGGSCSGNLGSVQCDLSSLAAGGSTNIQINVLTLQLGTVTATATASANEPDPAPGNNSDSATTRVTLLQRDSSEAQLQLAARLDVPPGDGRDRGEIFVDSRLAGIDDTAGVELAWNATPGEHLVEAVLTQASGRSGRWSFELRVSPQIEIIGVRVEAGELLSSDPRALSFHLRGESGERVRFRYLLR